MPWVLLLIAGLLEVVWATALKQSNGFSHVGWSALTVVAAAASFWLLGLALKALPVGTAYAVWVGVGAVGAAIAGILLFKEPATAWRLASIGLILAGVAGLRLSGGNL